MPAEGAYIFGGMMVADSFSPLFRHRGDGAVALVVLSSIDYFKTHRNTGEFYALLLLAAAAIMLVASSTNLVMMFLSLEFLTLTTAVLVCYLYDNPSRQKPRSSSSSSACCLRLCCSTVCHSSLA